MPEVIKSDGNNKYTDRLDCRRSDWLLIFGSLEYWLCSRVEGRTWIIAIDEALNLFIWVQHLIQEDISCLLLDKEEVSLRKVTTHLPCFLHVFCKHMVIAFFYIFFYFFGHRILGEMDLYGCYELVLDLKIKTGFFVLFWWYQTMYLLILNIMKYLFMKMWAGSVMT